MSSDQINKLHTVLESMVLPTGNIESNVSMTRPRLNRHDNVESNNEAVSSDELISSMTLSTLHLIIQLQCLEMIALITVPLQEKIEI